MNARHALRERLASDDRGTVLQALELLVTVGDNELVERLAEGITIQSGGMVEAPALSSSPPERLLAALALLRMAGRIAEVTRISGQVGSLADLAPLQDAVGPLELRLRVQDWSAPAPAGLPVTVLRLSGVREPTALDKLTPLAQLEGLDLLDRTNPLDLSALVKMTTLRWLRMSALGVPSLQPLKQTRLTQLNLRSADTRTLRLPASLEALSLFSPSRLHDLQLLSEAPRLRALFLRGLDKVTDLSALSTQHSLEELTVELCPAHLPAAMLATLPRLRRLSLRRMGPNKLPPYMALRTVRWLDVAFSQETQPQLRGQHHLLCDLHVDESGAPHCGGETLRGAALLNALSVHPPAGMRHPLQDVRVLDLRYLSLSPLSRFPSIERIHLWTLHKSTLLPLITLPRLREVRGQYTHRGRWAVQRWQRALLAEALEPNPAWVALAESRGVLPPPLPPSEVAAVRSALSSRRLQDQRAALTRLGEVGDIGTPPLLAGVSLLETGQLQLTDAARRAPHFRRRARQAWMALSLLRLSGPLHDAVRLCLGPPAAAGELRAARGARQPRGPLAPRRRSVHRATRPPDAARAARPRSDPLHPAAAHSAGSSHLCSRRECTPLRAVTRCRVCWSVSEENRAGLPCQGARLVVLPGTDEHIIDECIARQRHDQDRLSTQGPCGPIHRGCSCPEMAMPAALSCFRSAARSLRLVLTRDIRWRCCCPARKEHPKARYNGIACSEDPGEMDVGSCANVDWPAGGRVPLGRRHLHH